MNKDSKIQELEKKVEQYDSVQKDVSGTNWLEWNQQ